MARIPKATHPKFILQRLRLTFLIALLSSISIASFGWGRTGHHIVIDVAQSIASNSTLDSITKYLADETWQAASTWMDELRGNSQFDYMRKWHYINLEPTQAYSPTIENGDNVVTQLDAAIRNLKNRRNLSPDQVKLNLKVLFHLAGDLHNPLHVGYGTDRGGNDVKVIFNDKTFSLHRIWDTEIIESQPTTRSDIMDRLQKTKKRKLKRLAKGSAPTWFLDSRAALPVVYSLTSDTITTPYLEQGYPVAENLLFLGGVRLGVTLNEIFRKY
jgi:hypothetical protein